MPSSYKTPFLNLNKFVGTDKPKMDDVNYDNSRIDSAIKAHIENNQVHVSAQEKEDWNKGSYIVGTYVGDDTSPREIVLGFKPRVCLVFQTGLPICEYDSNSGNNVRTAIATELGCTKYISLSQKGFKVESFNSSSPFGSTGRMNLQGENYVYIAYK